MFFSCLKCEIGTFCAWADIKERVFGKFFTQTLLLNSATDVFCNACMVKFFYFSFDFLANTTSDIRQEDCQQKVYVTEETANKVGTFYRDVCHATT